MNLDHGNIYSNQQQQHQYSPWNPQLRVPVSNSLPMSNLNQAILLQNRIVQARKRNILFKQNIVAQLAVGVPHRLRQPVNNSSESILKSQDYEFNEKIKSVSPSTKHTHFPSNEENNYRKDDIPVTSTKPNIQRIIPSSRENVVDEGIEASVLSTQNNNHFMAKNIQNQSLIISSLQLEKIAKEAESSCLNHQKYLEDLDKLHQTAKNTNDKSRRKAKLKEENKKDREKIQSLLSNQKHIESVDSMPKPLWRHKLLGNHNPPKATIISGRKLFRVIAWSVVVMIISPLNLVYQRKKKKAESSRRELDKSLRIMLESFAEWMGKVVQLPLVSIVQDSTLNFDFSEPSAMNSAGLRSRLLQFKVRLKAMVVAISQSSPPNHMLTLLGGLLDDDLYFPEGFLWEYEKDNLECNRIGGVIHTLCEYSLSNSKLKDEWVTIAASKSQSDNKQRINLGRAKMLIVSTILIKTLLLRVILTPWFSGVCPKPAPNRQNQRIVFNLRSFATCFYHLLRYSNSQLPALVENEVGKDRSSATNSAQYVTGNIPKKSFLRSIISSVVKAKSLSVANEVAQSDLDESLLMNRRDGFDSVLTLKQSLLAIEYLDGPQATLLEFWNLEIKPLLDDWLQNLLRDIISEKFRNRYSSVPEVLG